jgi:choline dehydrogenase
MQISDLQTTFTPSPIEEAIAMNEFDFIVVGVGSAGAVVANRLTENPYVRVLALEAGGSRVPPNVANPSAWTTLLGSEIDWNYTSVPQPGLDGRVTREPRGKLPGGSSNLYIMMHVRGHQSDYDNWAYNGCPGWSYQDLLPYFQKLEDQEDNSSPWAGKGGPLHVANAKLHNPNPTSEAFISACMELGYNYTPDFNGTMMEGVGWHHVNIKDGKRQSTAVAYLNPILERPNLTVSTNSQVTRLLFDGDRCRGLEYQQNGELKTVYANCEVIVCSGAIESPKLLLLSGIGSGDRLKEFNIPVVADLPGVGENFHNHVLAGVIYETSQPVPPPQQNLSESALFCKSAPGWIGPDLQIAFVHVPFDIIIGQNYPNAISILPGVVRPMSRGWVRLASSNPLDKPLINPNYLGVESDRDRLIRGVEIAREIFATSAFSGWVKGELLPGNSVSDREQLEAFVKQRADSYHHQAGSCKMGTDSMAVVDPHLRVYGVEGLRVADASVMPVVPSGNCHTGIVAIAEKVSDLIKQQHGV